MNSVVRISVDGDREILSDLLNRIIKDYQEEKIGWLKFLGFFSKRGKLEGYNEIQISPSKRKNDANPD